MGRASKLPSEKLWIKFPRTSCRFKCFSAPRLRVGDAELVRLLRSGLAQEVRWYLVASDSETEQLVQAKNKKRLIGQGDDKAALLKNNGTDATCVGHKALLHL